VLRLIEVLTADQAGFVTRPVARARLLFGGIEGDRHFGLTRPSCSRTPWHARGTMIANTRQISILSVEECAEIARRLAIERVEPRLIGANLVLEGDPDLTGLAPATRLVFPSGAVIFVTEENHPCRHAGKVLADAFGKERLELEFVKAAQGRRGLVAMVEREGEVAAGDAVKVVTPRARSIPSGP
jgi:MOSC domain-containing protein YiiM